MAAYAWGVEVGKLDVDALDAIVTKAIGTDLIEPERRRLLLARIPAGVRASLPRLSRPDDQLRSDVLQLNELGWIEAWLTEAKKLSHVFAPAAPTPMQVAAVAASPNAPRPVARVEQITTESWSVLVVDEANTRLCGSGVIVGSRHILTAKHVVTGFDRCRVRLTTAGVAHPATVTWRSPDLDVALLITDDIIDSEASITVRTQDGPIAGDVYWQAYGYPALYAKTPSESLQQEGGRTHAWAAGSVLPLTLTIQGGPKGERALNGLSGAGVLIGGRVVAIITAFEKARQQERIDAIPLARFFGAADFRKAVGLPMFSDGAEQERRAWLKKLRAEYETQTKGLSWPDFASIQTETADAIANRLKALAKADVDRAVDLCELVLPLADDWADFHVEQRACLEAGNANLHAPDERPMLRDAFVARLDNRRAQLGKAPEAWLGGLSKTPKGKVRARLAKPVSADAPYFADVAAEEVPRHLARWLVGDLGALSDADLFREALDLLNELRSGDDDERHSPYVDMDHAAMPEVVAAIRRRFPKLWLVCARNLPKGVRRRAVTLKRLQTIQPPEDA